MENCTEFGSHGSEISRCYRARGYVRLQCGRRWRADFYPASPSIGNGQDLAEKIRTFVKAPKFLTLARDRSKALGQISETEFCIQLYPLLMTEFTRALAILSGKIEPLVDTEAQIASAASENEDKEKRKSTKLLLVEDNEINRIVLMRQIEMLGFTVEFAKNGMEGFSKWENGAFDLILSDCQMPLVDGFEMATMIRRREAETGLASTPILRSQQTP